MLFNSNVFLFAFLPVALLLFVLLLRANQQRAAIVWLVGASLFFYGWWDLAFLPLIVFSVTFNYVVARYLERRDPATTAGRLALAGGVAVNLGLLGYFKYSIFFLESSGLGEMGFSLGSVTLPIGISFFTFQQIAYLVETARRTVSRHSFWEYAAFICFFPQLIAGPIVHHSEFLPQIRAISFRTLSSGYGAAGLTFLIMGLFKKVVIADSLSPTVGWYFSLAATQPLSFVEGWLSALSYTLQLYFDFSGYSDMAIGLALLFGLRLPVNFNSPYKAGSAIEFWRRWHITLSRFLRDYLYIPLGGNRRGRPRMLANLLVTMVLGGIWHGAGWMFMVWGLWHGVLLCINHAWRWAMKDRALMPRRYAVVLRASGYVLTFVGVTVGWVFFRAPDMATAVSILSGMAGFNTLAPVATTADGAQSLSLMFGVVAALLAVVWLAPNTQQIMRYESPDGTIAAPDPHEKRRGFTLVWRPNIRWAALMALSALISVALFNRTSEFLYFQF